MSSSSQFPSRKRQRICWKSSIGQRESNFFGMLSTSYPRLRTGSIFLWLDLPLSFLLWRQGKEQQHKTYISLHSSRYWKNHFDLSPFWKLKILHFLTFKTSRPVVIHNLIYIFWRERDLYTNFSFLFVIDGSLIRCLPWSLSFLCIFIAYDFTFFLLSKMYF